LQLLADLALALALSKKIFQPVIFAGELIFAGKV
jgi:hypothetical protein